MRHPLHPVLVHFPIACWSLAALADVGSIWYGKSSWQWSAGLLTVGCSVGFIAMAAGLVELPRVPNGLAFRDAFLHLGLMLVAFAFFTVRLLLGMSHLRPVAPDSLVFTLDALGFTALVIGGWLGGRLVYGYGIGR